TWARSTIAGPSAGGDASTSTRSRCCFLHPATASPSRTASASRRFIRRPRLLERTLADDEDVGERRLAPRRQNAALEARARETLDDPARRPKPNALASIEAQGCEDALFDERGKAAPSSLRVCIAHEQPPAGPDGTRGTIDDRVLLLDLEVMEQI